MRVRCSRKYLRISDGIIETEKSFVFWFGGKFQNEADDDGDEEVEDVEAHGANGTQHRGTFVDNGFPIVSHQNSLKFSLFR